jgi:hypothetical protein
MEAATEAPAHAAKKPLLMPVQFDSLEKVRMPATAVHSSASIGMSACEAALLTSAPVRMRPVTIRVVTAAAIAK